MADLDPRVKQTLEQVEAGEKEHRARIRRYDAAYDVYRASEPRAKGVESWQSKLRVKYGMQVIDTALVNIVSGQPRVIVRPRRPDSELQAKAMQLALDYYVGEDHLVEKQPVFVQQALITGVTVAKNHWLYRTQKRPGRDFSVGPDGLLNGKPILQEIVTRDGPSFDPWDSYRCYWAPGARDVDDAAYIVLQTYVSKDDLLDNRCTSPHGGQPCNGLYHNVDALIASGATKAPTQSAQDRLLNLGANRYKDKFLIEEVWTDSTFTAIGNGQVLVRLQDNPYWHGHKPVVISQTRPDLFEMVGISETELVDDLQQAQWTLQNMVMDNLHLTTMRGITYREGSITDPNALQLRPRFKWPVTDHDDIRPFEIQPIATDVFTERQRLLADMQLVTGINPYISGTDAAGVDQNTATGVTALQEVASRLLRFKASQIHYKGYQRSFEMWGDMVQQFLDRPLMVKIEGPGNAANWVQLGPAEVAGHFAYTLEGSEESLSRQQERGEAVALLNAFAPLASLNIVNFKPILEKVAAAYGFPNPESLLAAPPPQQPPAAPMPGGGGQQMPQAPQLPPGLAQQPQLDPRLANVLQSIRQR